MKKSIIFILYVCILLINLNAFSFHIDNDNDRTILLFYSFSYNLLINDTPKIHSFNIIELTFLESKNTSIHFGFFTQFSPDISLFDIYLGGGTTIYPFQKVLSFSGNFYYGLSIFTLNHFSYIIDAKMNLDILKYKIHCFTIGTGFRHRNALKIINYFKLDENYFKNYYCYFFEIGYRIIL